MAYRYDNKISLVLSFSALGDYICVLPALKAMLSEGRLHKALTYPYRIKLLEVAGIDPEHIFVLDEKVAKPFDTCGYKVFDISADASSAPFRMHLTDYASYNACSAILKPSEKNIPLADKSKLPANPYSGGRYVVIAPTYHQPSRRFTPDTFDRIKRHCLASGYEIIILGSNDPHKEVNGAEFDLKGCLNLVNKTTLLESIAIIGDAKAVVTMDSGLVYLAAMTDTPIVAGYTFVDPYYRLPYRHNELGWKCKAVVPKSGCKFCSNTLAAYFVTFDSECPAGLDFECTKKLDPEDFVAGLEELL